MILGVFLFYASAFAVSLFLALCILLKATSQEYPIVLRSKKEKYFFDPASGETILFPSITDKSTIHLSIVIPAYNEEERLHPMLSECVKFLEDRCQMNKDFKYEIIVVSDGSKDKTVEVAYEYCKALKEKCEKIRVLELEENRGKGGAVRLGVQNSRGALILFADADGATTFEDIAKLETILRKELKCNYLEDPQGVSDKLAICIGSRSMYEKESVATRSFFRTILMYGFHYLVWLFAVKDIKDTQCGFKLFTRKAAYMCFESIHVERWAFDVELLYIAQRLQIPIWECCVRWTEIEGSKITPVWSWVQMGVDLGLIWLRYKTGIWKILKQKSD